MISPLAPHVALFAVRKTSDRPLTRWLGRFWPAGAETDNTENNN